MPIEIKKLIEDSLNPGSAINSILSGAALLGIGSVGTFIFARRRAHKSLRGQAVLGDETILTETAYFEIPNTNLQEQCIRNRKTIDLKDIYPEEQWKMVSKYLQAAKGKCIDDEEIIAMHLPKVLPKKHVKAITGEIMRHLRTAVATALNESWDAYCIEDHPIKNEKKIYFFLVHEPKAQQQQFRIILMSEYQLLNAQNLDKTKVRIEGDTNPDLYPLNTHHQYDRTDTMSKISKLHRDGKLNDIIGMSWVGVKKKGPNPDLAAPRV